MSGETALTALGQRAAASPDSDSAALCNLRGSVCGLLYDCAYIYYQSSPCIYFESPHSGVCLYHEITAISMLPVLSLAIYVLLRSLRGVDARAINTAIASLPISNISSSMLSESTNDTISSQSCKNIKTCRTLDQIVVSCLVTILACVWFAVHRNIPAPKPTRPRHPNFFVGCAKSVWYTVLDQRESLIVFLVAFLAPEWILAWALRQALRVRILVRQLKNASEEADRRHAGGVDSEGGTGYDTGGAEGHPCFDEFAANRLDTESIPLTGIKRRSSPSKSDAICKKCEGRGNQCDLVAAAKRVAKVDAGWEWSHAFFIIMGGFFFYNGDGPLHPLSPANVLELVARGHLVPPTAEEISNQSKGDALSKGIAIIQTLWFVMQCIARRHEGLHVTTLEVMTLAYTVLTVAMYAAWWAKPLNVKCAVRVPEEQVEIRKAREYTSIWERMVDCVIGGQDSYVDLRQRKRVPIFWAGKPSNEVVLADAVALLVAMAFGAVHCFAWYSVSQSHLIQQLWRGSAIAIIAAPVALAFVTGITLLTETVRSDIVNFLAGALFIAIAIVYIVARIILITLSFMTLKGLPLPAYQTVQWTTLIPHI